MRVLVFEPQFAGHNLSYVMHLITHLIAFDCDVHLITSNQATESEEFANHLGHLEGTFQCHPLNDFVGRPGGRGICVNGPAGNFALLKGLYRGLRMVRPDHVYVPCGNPIAHWAGLPNPVSRELRRGSIEAELVLLFGKYAYEHTGLRSRLKEWMALAVLSRGPWARIHHIVPRAVQVMSAFSRNLQTKARLLPDPVDTVPEMSKVEARQLLNISTFGRIISLVGLIERRKGVFELLDGFTEALSSLKPTDRVLLAGKSTDEVRDALNSRYNSLMQSGRVISIDRHLTSDELWAACIGADVVCTPYPNHRYSASIVIRAAAAGVPVLANSIGWMQEIINEFSLGTTCNTNLPVEFACNIRNSLEQSPSFQIGDSARNFIDYHTAANFASHLTKRLADRMGILRATSQTLDWSDVSVSNRAFSNSRAA